MMFARGPSQILSYLYLGSMQDAAKHSLLKELGIAHVLNVMSSCAASAPSGIKCLHVPMSDYGDTPLAEVAEECASFISQARQKGEKALVHCALGSSRAPAVVITYLMLHEGMSLEQSWSLVKAKRNVVAIQEDYLHQLARLEQTIAQKRAQ